MYIDDEYKTYVNSSGLIYSEIFSFVGGWGLEGDPYFIRIKGIWGGGPSRPSQPTHPP